MAIDTLYCLDTLVKKHDGSACEETESELDEHGLIYVPAHLIAQLLTQKAAGSAHHGNFQQVIIIQSCRTLTGNGYPCAQQKKHAQGTARPVLVPVFEQHKDTYGHAGNGYGRTRKATGQSGYHKRFPRIRQMPCDLCACNLHKNENDNQQSNADLEPACGNNLQHQGAQNASGDTAYPQPFHIIPVNKPPVQPAQLRGTWASDDAACENGIHGREAKRKNGQSKHHGTKTGNPADKAPNHPAEKYKKKRHHCLTAMPLP